MDWYLLRTKPREEWRAKQHLENQDFTTYFPILVRKDGPCEPLFPGYIFVTNEDEQVSMHSIRSTRGVLGFVRFGMEFAAADEKLIEEIRTIERMYQDVPKFVPGQVVACKSGPFAGLEAIFKAENGLERCVILLKILNAERSIEVDQADLKAI